MRKVIILIICSTGIFTGLTLFRNAHKPTYLNKPYMFIHVWADWCKPCIEELPKLNHEIQSYDSLYKILYTIDSSDVTMEMIKRFSLNNFDTIIYTKKRTTEFDYLIDIHDRYTVPRNLFFRNSEHIATYKGVISDFDSLYLASFQQ